MNVTINGQVRDVPAGITVEQLLLQFHVGHERVAVEHNQRILENTEFVRVVVQEGDALEVVRFVGGG